MMILMCFAALTLLGLTQPQDEARVRIVYDPSERVLVGQQVPFAIEVLVTRRFDGTPRFDLERVPGAILLRIPGRPTFGSARIDGVDYTSYRYEFGLYPQRAGEHSVPPIEVRGATVTEIGQPPRDFRASTEAFAVEATLPPGAEDFSTLLTSKNFTVEERWKPSPPTAPDLAQVGDAFRRIVTMRSSDVLGMSMPELPLPEIEGLRVYPRRPEVKDSSNRGVIEASSQQTLVYLCEKAGTFEIPEIVLPWFDLQNDALDHITLPAVRVEVEAPPPGATAGNVDDANDSANDDPNLGGLVFAFGLAVLVAIAVHRHRVAYLASPLYARRRARATLLTACERNDPRAALEALWLELGLRAPSGTTPVALNWARDQGNAGLVTAIAELQQAYVRAEPWQGAALRQALAELEPSRSWRDRRRTPTELAPLNP